MGDGGMLDLSDVTLVCVDTATPALGLAAMARSAERVRFGAQLLFTDPQARLDLPPGVRRVPLHIADVPAYSHFMLRGLAAHVHTRHCLVVQWDGWLSTPSAWRDEFLAFDYIGAPWVDQAAGFEVGNGGFSLRSRRLLLALADPELAIHHPEDVCLCVDNRLRLETVHGLRFAPVDLARRFAIEHEDAQDIPALGFHGLFNLHRVLDDRALTDLLRQLSPAQCWGKGGRMLWRALVAQGRLEMAGRQLDLATPALPWAQQARYRARLWARRLAVAGAA